MFTFKPVSDFSMLYLAFFWAFSKNSFKNFSTFFSAISCSCCDNSNSFLSFFALLLFFSSFTVNCTFTILGDKILKKLLFSSFYNIFISTIFLETFNSFKPFSMASFVVFPSAIIVLFILTFLSLTTFAHRHPKFFQNFVCQILIFCSSSSKIFSKFCLPILIFVHFHSKF